MSLFALSTSRRTREPTCSRNEGNGRALAECLLLFPFAGDLGFVLLFASSPCLERRREGAGGADGGIDGSTSEKRRDGLCNFREWQNRRGVLLRGVSQFFQSREGLFGGKIEHAFVRGNDLKIESHHAVKEGLVGRKVGSIFRLIGQTLSDRCGCFCHLIPSFLLEAVFWYMVLSSTPYTLVYTQVEHISTPESKG